MKFFWLLSFVFLTLHPLSAQETASGTQRVQFDVHSDFREATPWVKKLMRSSIKSIDSMLGGPDVQLPPTIHVQIKNDQKVKGIRGYASHPKSLIGFSSHVWPNEKHRRWILIHELVNLLSAYYGKGGFPSDWWSNGRSPFPEYISCLVMQKNGARQDATWRRNVHKSKKDHRLYWKLHEKYGVKLFQDFFTLIRNDNLDLRQIGKPWPHPDKTRSLYAIAYLSLAAGENLAPLMSRYDIGKRPGDWHQRHPEIRFKPYTVTAQEVEQIMNLRQKIFVKKAGKKRQKELFLQGLYIDLIPFYLNITLLGQSPKSYANAEFASAAGPRALGALSSLRCGIKSYANAEFASAAGPRALGALSSLRCGIKSYANAEFASAAGPRALGALSSLRCGIKSYANAEFVDKQFRSTPSVPLEKSHTGNPPCHPSIASVPTAA